MTEGFAVIPNDIARDGTFDPKAKLLYVILTSHAGADMTCFPSHALLAEESGYSVATVKRALEYLRDRDMIWWELDTVHGSPGRRPNLYHLYPRSSQGATSGSPSGHSSEGATSQLSQSGHPAPTELLRKPIEEELHGGNAPAGDDEQALDEVDVWHATLSLLALVGLTPDDIQPADLHRIERRLHRVPYDTRAQLVESASGSPPRRVQHPLGFILARIEAADERAS